MNPRNKALELASLLYSIGEDGQWPEGFDALIISCIGTGCQDTIELAHRVYGEILVPAFMESVDL